MSLINDALRRAKQAHDRMAPRAPGPELLPVEPAAQPGHRSGLIIPVITLVGLGLTLFFGWWMFPHNGSVKPTRLVPRSVSAARDARAPRPLLQPVTTYDKSAESLSIPAQVTNSGPVPSRTRDAGAATAVRSAAATGATNTARPLTQPPLAQAAPLKLQGIFFHPTRPAAMISGNTVYIGDQVGNLRVVAIDQQSATLAAGGQTNILKLPQQF